MKRVFPLSDVINYFAGDDTTLSEYVADGSDDDLGMEDDEDDIVQGGLEDQEREGISNSNTCPRHIEQLSLLHQNLQDCSLLPHCLHHYVCTQAPPLVSSTCTFSM